MFVDNTVALEKSLPSINKAVLLPTVFVTSLPQSHPVGSKVTAPVPEIISGASAWS